MDESTSSPPSTSDALTLWMPNLDHIDLQSAGGQRTLDNVRLAHCVCNRVDYNKNHGIPFAKVLASVEEARRQAIEDNQ